MLFVFKKCSDIVGIVLILPLETEISTSDSLTQSGALHSMRQELKESCPWGFSPNLQFWRQSSVHVGGSQSLGSGAPKAQESLFLLFWCPWTPLEQQQLLSCPERL